MRLGCSTFAGKEFTATGILPSLPNRRGLRFPLTRFWNVVWVIPGVLDVTGNSDSGPICWRIRSWAVELAFVLWCGSQHPRHPQLRAWAWIPASLRPLNQR